MKNVRIILRLVELDPRAETSNESSNWMRHNRCIPENNLKLTGDRRFPSLLGKLVIGENKKEGPVNLRVQICVIYPEIPKGDASPHKINYSRNQFSPYDRVGSPTKLRTLILFSLDPSEYVRTVEASAGPCTYCT
jgi:hypothetical protein